MGDKLKALIRKVQKEHGPGSIKIASDTRAAGVGRISTGIFILDYAIGGGIPIGRTCIFYGKKSSGKSALTAKVVAAAQKMCRKCYGKVIFEMRDVTITKKVVNPDDGTIKEVPEKVQKPFPINCVNKCLIEPIPEEGEEPVKKKDKDKAEKFWPGPMNVVWIDAEGTYSAPFYEKFGVDNDRVHLIVSDYGEQAIDIADSAIRTGEVDLLVTDSIAHLVPKKEREESAEDWQVALQARLVNKAMRVWTASLNELEARGLHTDCTIVLTNQTRQKPGQMFPVEVLPGGMGQEFAASLEIRLWQKELKFDTGGRPLWQDTRFSIEKNKAGVPKMEGFYRLCLLEHPGRKPGDTWDDEAVAESALTEGFTTKKDGKLVCLGKKFDGEAEFRAEVSERGELYDTLRGRLLDLIVGRPSDGVLAQKKEKEYK